MNAIPTNDIFHYCAGAFALDMASYLLDDDLVICEVVAGINLHQVKLDNRDAQRFAQAVLAAGSHIRWQSGGLPRRGTLYEIETATDGRVTRVCWWWHNQDGRLSGADALAFLRSAGSLQTCVSCGQERIIYPDLETPICGACGFYAQDGPGTSLLLGTEPPRLPTQIRPFTVQGN